MRGEDLVGAWRELGREFVSGDGNVRPDVARTSQIMYTPDGFMGVVNTPTHRPPVSPGTNVMSLDGIDAAERAAAAEGVVAYTGRYEIKGDIVQHTIYSSLNPNLVGTTQLRRVTLAGDDLTLSALPDAQGNFFRIRWCRAGRMP
jgi:Lipocalin-like domain